MRRNPMIGLLIGPFLALSMVVGAQAKGNIPLPRERPQELIVAQAMTNPDPLNTKHIDFGAQQPQVSTAPASTPIIVNAPQPASGILDYIKTAIMGLFAAIFGKLAFKLPEWPGSSQPGAPAQLDSGKITDIVTAVLHPSGTSILADPNLRANVDAALLKVVQSGLPGQAIQTGLSFVPGAGPFATTIEPIVRNVVIQLLQKHAGAGGVIDPATGLTPPPAAANPPQDQLAAFANIVDGLIKSHLAKPAAAA